MGGCASNVKARVNLVKETPSSIISESSLADMNGSLHESGLDRSSGLRLQHKSESWIIKSFANLIKNSQKDCPMAPKNIVVIEKDSSPAPQSTLGKSFQACADQEINYSNGVEFVIQLDHLSRHLQNELDHCHFFEEHVLTRATTRQLSQENSHDVQSPKFDGCSQGIWRSLFKSSSSSNSSFKFKRLSTEKLLSRLSQFLQWHALYSPSRWSDQQSTVWNLEWHRLRAALSFHNRHESELRALQTLADFTGQTVMHEVLPTYTNSDEIFRIPFEQGGIDGQSLICRNSRGLMFLTGKYDSSKGQAELLELFDGPECEPLCSGLIWKTVCYPASTWRKPTPNCVVTIEVLVDEDATDTIPYVTNLSKELFAERSLELLLPLQPPLEVYPEAARSAVLGTVDPDITILLNQIKVLFSVATSEKMEAILIQSIINAMRITCRTMGKDELCMVEIPLIDAYLKELRFPQLATASRLRLYIRLKSWYRLQLLQQEASHESHPFFGILVQRTQKQLFHPSGRDYTAENSASDDAYVVLSSRGYLSHKVASVNVEQSPDFSWRYSASKLPPPLQATIPFLSQDGVYDVFFTMQAIQQLSPMQELPYLENDEYPTATGMLFNVCLTSPQNQNASHEVGAKTTTLKISEILVEILLFQKAFEDYVMGLLGQNAKTQTQQKGSCQMNTLNTEVSPLSVEDVIFFADSMVDAGTKPTADQTSVDRMSRSYKVTSPFLLNSPSTPSDPPIAPQGICFEGLSSTFDIVFWKLVASASRKSYFDTCRISKCPDLVYVLCLLDRTILIRPEPFFDLSSMRFDWMCSEISKTQDAKGLRSNLQRRLQYVHDLYVSSKSLTAQLDELPKVEPPKHGFHWQVEPSLIQKNSIHATGLRFDVVGGLSLEAFAKSSNTSQPVTSLRQKVIFIPLKCKPSQLFTAFKFMSQLSFHLNLRQLFLPASDNIVQSTDFDVPTEKGPSADPYESARSNQHSEVSCKPLLSFSPHHSTSYPMHINHACRSLVDIFKPDHSIACVKEGCDKHFEDLHIIDNPFDLFIHSSMKENVFVSNSGDTQVFHLDYTSKHFSPFADKAEEDVNQLNSPQVDSVRLKKTLQSYLLKNEGKVCEILQVTQGRWKFEQCITSVSVKLPPARLHRQKPISFVLESLGYIYFVMRDQTSKNLILLPCHSFTSPENASLALSSPSSSPVSQPILIPDLQTQKSNPYDQLINILYLKLQKLSASTITLQKNLLPESRTIVVYLLHYLNVRLLSVCRRHALSIHRLAYHTLFDMIGNTSPIHEFLRKWAACNIWLHSYKECLDLMLEFEMPMSPSEIISFATLPQSLLKENQQLAFFFDLTVAARLNVLQADSSLLSVQKLIDIFKQQISELPDMLLGELFCLQYTILMRDQSELLGCRDSETIDSTTDKASNRICENVYFSSQHALFHMGSENATESLVEDLLPECCLNAFDDQLDFFSVHDVRTKLDSQSSRFRSAWQANLQSMLALDLRYFFKKSTQSSSLSPGTRPKARLAEMPWASYLVSHMHETPLKIQGCATNFESSNQQKYVLCRRLLCAIIKMLPLTKSKQWILYSSQICSQVYLLLHQSFNLFFIYDPWLGWPWNSTVNSGDPNGICLFDEWASLCETISTLLIVTRLLFDSIEGFIENLNLNFRVMQQLVEGMYALLAMKNVGIFKKLFLSALYTVKVLPDLLPVHHPARSRSSTPSKKIQYALLGDEIQNNHPLIPFLSSMLLTLNFLETTKEDKQKLPFMLLEREKLSFIFRKHMLACNTSPFAISPPEYPPACLQLRSTDAESGQLKFCKEQYFYAFQCEDLDLDSKAFSSYEQTKLSRSQFLKLQADVVDALATEASSSVGDEEIIRVMAWNISRIRCDIVLWLQAHAMPYILAQSKLIFTPATRIKHKQQKGECVSSVCAIGLNALQGYLGVGIPKCSPFNENLYPLMPEYKQMNRNVMDSGIDVWWTPQVISIPYFEKRKVIDVACGEHHSIACDVNGNLHAWGSNAFGQCGLSINFAHATKPQSDKPRWHVITQTTQSPKTSTRIEKAIRKDRSFTSGFKRSSFEMNSQIEPPRKMLSVDSKSRCELNNPSEYFEIDNAFLGDEVSSAWQASIFTPKEIPVQQLNHVDVQQRIKFKSVSCGAEFSAALTTAGNVYLWGSNKDYCVSADAAIDHVSSPQKLNIDQSFDSLRKSLEAAMLESKVDHISNCFDAHLRRYASRLEKITSIKCGSFHVALLDSFGGVWLHGQGEAGQLGFPPASKPFEPIMPQNSGQLSTVAIEPLIAKYPSRLRLATINVDLIKCNSEAPRNSAPIDTVQTRLQSFLDYLDVDHNHPNFYDYFTFQLSTDCRTISCAYTDQALIKFSRKNPLQALIEEPSSHFEVCVKNVACGEGHTLVSASHAESERCDILITWGQICADHFGSACALCETRTLNVQAMLNATGRSSSCSFEQYIDHAKKSLPGSRSAPVILSLPQTSIPEIILDIYAGGCFNLCIYKSGRMLVWGANTAEVLGFPEKEYSFIPEPKFLQLPVNFQAQTAAFSMGLPKLYIVSRNGELLSLGKDTYGSSGRLSSLHIPRYIGDLKSSFDRLSGVDSQTTPTKLVPINSKIAKVAAGLHHTILVTQQDTVT